MRRVQENMETKQISSVDTAETNHRHLFLAFIAFTTFSLVNFAAMILFQLILGRGFRTNSRDESSRLSEPEEFTNQEVPALENGEEFMDENAERRMPAFSFKYQIQNLEGNLIMTDDEEDRGETENAEEDLLELKCRLYEEERLNSLTSETSSDFESDIQNRLNDEDDIEEAKCGEKLPSPVEIETVMEGNSEDTSAEKEITGRADFDEEVDELLEQEELIEQLKMELKKARAAGLPTIPEEFHSHRGIEALKPFRINLNFSREDPLDNLQIFYTSYKERMRKLDIIWDYEKLYALDSMKMKNPTHSFGIQGIDDLQRELEAGYVGEICLSWEFLRWQYEKSHELLESDPRRSRQYNQLADEFQLFRVLIRRFIENEQFHGPRIQNYAQQRCVFAKFLQVPLMKEDCLKENMENRESENAITAEMLEGIMEEAIKIFWEFVKAEKDKRPLLSKILIKNNAKLQDPSDYRLMEEIQSDLRKKEKKMKNLQRSGNCIVKKFKKPQEDISNKDLFFSQIDLKLVSRVLKMSRISSDQLSWCHRKLSKINFSPGKVHRDPSFLLFPC